VLKEEEENPAELLVGQGTFPEGKEHG